MKKTRYIGRRIWRHEDHAAIERKRSPRRL